MIGNDRWVGGWRRAIRVAIASTTILASTVPSRPARASDAAAAAEALFSAGKRLAQDGDYAAACPKFEESQKLDPGMGTLFRLADCYEHIGRTASAWAAFLDVATSAKAAGQQARAEDAKRRAGELEKSLSKLSIEVATPDLPGLVVRRGDVVVGKAQWNAPMPVDPGEIAIEASAPEHETWRGTVVVAANASNRIEVPSLAAAVPVRSELTREVAPVGPPPAFWSTQRTVAAVALGAGVVGLGVGGAFGLASISKSGDADGHCDAQNFCSDEGLGLRRDALDAGNLSTVFFIAGGVLATTGIVLWLTAPSKPSAVGSALPSRPRRIGFAPTVGGASFAMELP